VVEAFTKKYGVDKLIYYELHREANSALAREKRMKKWRRAWKIRSKEGANRDWKDLYDAIAG
jgi:putative endonuclease